MTDEQLDLIRIADDERLISALATGSPVAQVTEQDRALAGMLGTWRAELDASASALPPVDVRGPVRPVANAQRRPGRHKRAIVAAAAGVVTVLGMTGTAAAIGGAHGPLAPLHRILFGAPTSHQPADPLALQAGSLLKRAASRISAAASAGSITSADRASIGSILDAAGRLLQRDANAPKTLAQQADSLRAALARIPGAPSTNPSPSSIASGVLPSTPHTGRTEPEPANSPQPPMVVPPQPVPQPSTEPTSGPEDGPTPQPSEGGSDGGPETHPTPPPATFSPQPSEDPASGGATDGTENTLDR